MKLEPRHTQACTLIVTDRNGKHLETVIVSGPSISSVVSKRVPVWARLRKRYPDGYLFLEWSTLHAKASD